MKTCTMPTCTTHHYARGLCRKHYRQEWFTTPVGSAYEERQRVTRVAKRKAEAEAAAKLQAEISAEEDKRDAIRFACDKALLALAVTWLDERQLGEMLGDGSMFYHARKYGLGDTSPYLTEAQSDKLRGLLEKYYARWKHGPTEGATPSEVRQALDAYPPGK